MMVPVDVESCARCNDKIANINGRENFKLKNADFNGREHFQAYTATVFVASGVPFWHSLY